jgi:hypothetical protein
MVRLVVLLALLDVGYSFVQHGVRIGTTSLQLDRSRSPTTIVSMSSPSSSQTLSVSSWSELQNEIGQTPVGAALNRETELRSQGKGSAHVQNKLRTFRSTETPTITLFRDHAGWYVLLPVVSWIARRKHMNILIRSSFYCISAAGAPIGEYTRVDTKDRSTRLLSMISILCIL